jgi:hypothetical protein
VPQEWDIHAHVPMLASYAAGEPINETTLQDDRYISTHGIYILAQLGCKHHLLAATAQHVGDNNKLWLGFDVAARMDSFYQVIMAMNTANTKAAAPGAAVTLLLLEALLTHT